MLHHVSRITLHILLMTCLRCRTKMIEKKRSFHKQRKWVCARCGAARMQAQRPRPAKINRGAQA